MARVTAKRKKRRRVKFCDTKIGRYLLINAPLEYSIIYESMNPDKRRYCDVRIIMRSIEAIALASDNPAFRTSDFRIALIEFKRFGFVPKSKKKWCVRDAVKASSDVHSMLQE